ncbi:MAG TPA: hypothetical protein VL598_09400 [Trinickia sp.]|jgi:hypothetical protein|uniref:hypothetical protein n=1 Tax=Trinickia sp. TaxID=2571163 RepID=UPI002B53C51B|nr:hypothetical protein [Trinickia sp.]HTI17868.1 hypothetical protein [Trinickia sp.]
MFKRSTRAAHAASKDGAWAGELTASSQTTGPALANQPQEAALNTLRAIDANRLLAKTPVGMSPFITIPLTWIATDRRDPGERFSSTFWRSA